MSDSAMSEFSISTKSKPPRLLDDGDGFDEIILNLPDGFSQPATKPKPQRLPDDDGLDEIIRNLPPDFDRIAKKRKPSNEEDYDQTDERSSKRKRVDCSECGKRVSYAHLSRHMQNEHSGACYGCTFCEFKTKRLDYLKTHIARMHKDFEYKCGVCHEQFESRLEFFKEPHLSKCIKKCGRRAPAASAAAASDSDSESVQDEQPREPLPPSHHPPEFKEDLMDPPEIDQPFWLDPSIAPWIDHPQAVDEITSHWIYFRQRFRIDESLIQEYFFRTVGQDIQNFSIQNALRHIYLHAQTAFQFNMGITSLLRRELPNGEHEFRVFISQHLRQNVFNRNIHVHDIDSLRDAVRQIEELGDFIDLIDRPNTEWRPVAILGVAFYVYLRPQFVAGRGNSRLPKFLSLNTKSLLAMEWDNQRNRYTDNACLFRVLLAGSGRDHNDYEALQETFQIYRERTGCPDLHNFKGVPEGDLDLIEELFNVNLNIYRKTGPKEPVVCRRLGTHLDRRTINIHSHQIDATNVHFSLIKNLHNFAGKHPCVRCNKIFRDSTVLRHHMENNCNDAKTTRTYPGGCYEAQTNVFDKLIEFGVVIEKSRRRSHGLICWDIESCLEPVNNLKFERNEINEHKERRLNDQNIQVEYRDGDAKGLQVRETHKIVTAAMTSTIPGHTETAFFAGENSDLLVQEILDKMLEMSAANYAIERERFAAEFDQLDQRRLEVEAAIQLTEGEGDEPGVTEDDCRLIKMRVRRLKMTLKKIKRLVRQFDLFCKQTSVLHYNGGRYDLLVVKRHLFGKLVRNVREARQELPEEEHPPWPFSITRGSTIMCLSTDELRFVDVLNFAGPGVPLAKFMSTYGGEDSKLHFPYETVRSYQDLIDTTEFPPKQAFFSTLKNAGISEEHYEQAKALWDGMEGPKNLLSYIKLYNMSDVEPFLRAAVKMGDIFYDDFAIDIYKDSLSLPGVSLKVLFDGMHRSQPTARFGLFSEGQEQLCSELYASMTGGLAVIVNRRAVAGETPIRENPAIKVKKIEGFDFNALYLHAIMQPMPTGPGDHYTLRDDGEMFERQSETAEELLAKRRVHGEVHYMKFCAFRDNIYVHHAEHGPQTVLGVRSHRCDGFAKNASPRPRVYDYRGCRWHVHDVGCLNTRLNLDGVNEDIKKQDEARVRDLKDMNFDVHIRYECEFRQVQYIAKLIRNNMRYKLVEFTADLIAEAETYNRFLEKHPPRKFAKRKTVTYREVFDSIMDESVFGFVQATVKTKPELHDEHSDFPIVIRHADISLDDIGPKMRRVAEERGYLKKPRRALIGTYDGEKIWVLTPMLAFMQKHGCEVQKIHQICIFDKEKTFESFGQMVTEYRERGDQDKSQELLGNIYKLLGNSAYGKVLTRIDRHTETSYCDEATAAEAHNNPLHRKSTQLDDDCYEISRYKKEISFNLPHHIGLAVYQYSKLRVLTFVYDILQRFVSRELYDFLESDTDSIYLAIGKDSLRECIPPEKMAEFEALEGEWFVLDKSQRRRPGLLKVEKIGRAFIGLSAKLYIVIPFDGDQIKAATKGIQQERNAELISFINFDRILNEDEGGDGTAYNIGFRQLFGRIVTYVQEKIGMTHFDCKRRVVDNHRTLPLTTC